MQSLWHTRRQIRIDSKSALRGAYSLLDSVLLVDAARGRRVFAYVAARTAPARGGGVSRPHFYYKPNSPPCRRAIIVWCFNYAAGLLTVASWVCFLPHRNSADFLPILRAKSRSLNGLWRSGELLRAIPPARPHLLGESSPYKRRLVSRALRAPSAVPAIAISLSATYLAVLYNAR